MTEPVKQLLCMILCSVFYLSPALGDAGMITADGNIAGENAAYQYIVGDMSLVREGDVAFYDMTYILSKLFLVPQDTLNIYGNSSVRHTVLMDILWNYCGVDTTLIARNYAAETEFVTYEQFFDALDHFYFDIMALHGMTVRTANAYQLSGNTHLAFDDGSIVSIGACQIPDGRVTVTCKENTVVELSPIELPADINLSSMSEMRTVDGLLYYYSAQEGTVLLQTDNELKRFDIIENPACFSADGVSRDSVNKEMLDKPVVLYVTSYKKVPDVAVMILAEN